MAHSQLWLHPPIQLRFVRRPMHLLSLDSLRFFPFFVFCTPNVFRINLHVRLKNKGSSAMHTDDLKRDYQASTCSDPQLVVAVLIPHILQRTVDGPVMRQYDPADKPSLYRTIYIEWRNM